MILLWLRWRIAPFAVQVLIAASLGLAVDALFDGYATRADLLLDAGGAIIVVTLWHIIAYMIDQYRYWSLEEVS